MRSLAGMSKLGPRVGGGQKAATWSALDRIRSHAGTFFSPSGFLEVLADFSPAADAAGGPRARCVIENRCHPGCRSGGHGYVYGAHVGAMPGLRSRRATAHRFNCSMLSVAQ